MPIDSPMPQDALDLILTSYRRTHPNVVFLEVGAFDGISGDAIYPLIKKHSLCGVLVEPQPVYFDRLQANYAQFECSKFVFVNAAIGETDGYLPMYQIRQGAEGPSWLHQIASFDKSVVMKHADSIPNLESLIEVHSTRCITFDTLFSETGVGHIDVLQIDVEGLDAQILKLFDISRRKPAIVRFEHKHLAPEDYESCLHLLRGQGYWVSIYGQDTLAYQPGY